MRVRTNLGEFWTGTEDRTKERLCLALLFAVVVLAYANTLLNGFTMDDLGYVVRNAQVTEPSLRGFFTAHKTSNVFRPLTFATFALDWRLGGGIALGFHAVNLVVHAIVTCLVLVLVQSLFQESRHGRAIAFATALLFAVHPIHTEAVASIVGRSELLAAAFLLIAWILHLQDRDLPALGCFVLALLSKESALVFVPLVGVTDYAAGKLKKRSRYLRIAAIAIIYLALLWKVQGGRFGPADISVIDNPLVHIPTAQRILNALRVAWKYVALQLYPARLSADYSYNQIPVYGALRYTLPAAISSIFLLGACIWAAAKKRYRGIVLAVGIYIASFAITANVLKPIGTIMAERLAYFPSLGFCLLLALAWTWLWERRRTLAMALAAATIALLAARTIIRNRDWEDNRTLAQAQLRAAPNSVKTHQNMALVYMEAKRFDLARKELDIELQIYPQNPIGVATYGLLESWQGNYEEAGRKMEQAFYTMRRDDPAYDEVAVNLASLYVKTNHIDAALDLLNREIAKSPRYDPAWANRALAHYKRGETDAARADAETALRLDANNQDAKNVMHMLNASAPSTSTP